MNTDQLANKQAEGWPVIGETLPKRGNRMTQWFSRTLLKWAGWQIAGGVINAPQMVLIGAPHTSNWDFILTILTMFALGVRFSWVAKHSLFRWPVAGLMTWLGGVRLDRQTTEGFVDQMVEEFNRRPQFLLAIMPEGTRSKVREWRSGFYYIALRAQVPMLPVIFDYGHKLLRLGPMLSASGDAAADLPRIQSFYQGVKGKRDDSGG